MDNESKILGNVPIHRQQQDNWCIPACAQMILGFHGKGDLDQETIADKMQTLEWGTALADEIAGYEEILENDFEVLKGEVSWDKGKSEIDAGFPFRIRVDDDKHAVVCIGYEKKLRPDDSGHHDLFLILNDPNGGERQHVNWDDISQDSYLYIHRT